MSRANITQADALDSILTRLRDQLALDDRHCYATLFQPGESAIPGGNTWVAVRPQGSGFDLEQTIVQCKEDWTVQITIYNRVSLDSAGHDDRTLIDATRGLYPLKRAVMKALAGHDLVTAAGDTFLRVLLKFSACSAPESMAVAGKQSAGVAFLTLNLEVSFDWELTE